MSQFAGFEKSFKAGQNLNTTVSDWAAVYINSGSSVITVNTLTQKPIGVLQNRPNSGTGASCHVRLGATSKLTLNDTCTAGDLLVTGPGGIVRGTGLTISAVAATTVSRYVLGEALEASAATGSVIEVLINRYSIDVQHALTTVAATIAVVIP